MQHLADIATNAKTAIAVSAATTSTGLGAWLDVIPDDIGKLATLAGAVLSIVLVYTHTMRGRVERQKLKLEVTILEEKEWERLESSRKRKEQGLPDRRTE
jgi:hypothetical protein